MKYILQVRSILEYGQRKDADGKPHQEDCIFPAYGSKSPTGSTFILCDGMGGHDAGEVASRTVCETMGMYCNRFDDKFTDEDFEEALTDAYHALDAKDTGATKKMGTTLAFLQLHDGGATVAHIGDSRVYHIRPGATRKDTEILFATEDHSLVNSLIKAGELRKEETHGFQRRNVITRAMQPNMFTPSQADIHHITDIRPGDYFYLCSDGMLESEDMDNGTSLRNIFSLQGGNLKKKISILKRATKLNRDNHSAIVVHICDIIKKPKPFLSIKALLGLISVLIVIVAVIALYLFF